MKSVIFIISSIICSFVFNNCKAQQNADTLTAKQVVENAINAMGGKENLLEVKTLYTEFSTVLEGHPVKYVIREMFPNKGAFEIKYKEMTIHYDFFNGKNGYQIVKGEKKKTSKDAFKNKALKQNIFDELDYLNPGLFTLQLLGKETVNGESCYKIKTILSNGATDFVYYSDSSFLMLRTEHVSEAEPNRFKTSTFSEYKKFGKLLYFTKWVVDENNGTKQVITLDTLYTNQNVEESDFK